MPYVTRADPGDPNSRIVAMSARPQSPGQEHLADDHEDIVNPLLQAGEVAEMKRDAKARISARADELGALIAGAAPKFEQLSWPDKRAAATYVQEKIAAAEVPNAAEEPRLVILEAERVITGESLEDLAAAILQHVDTNNPANYYAAVGAIAGQRRATHEAIDALTQDRRADLVIAIAAVLETAEQQAQAILASLMPPAS